MARIGILLSLGLLLACGDSDEGSMSSVDGGGGATVDASRGEDAARTESDAASQEGDASLSVTEAAMGGDCPEPSGAGTEHGTDITGSETWKAADSPHRVTASITVKGTLTIEACAVVIMSEGVTLYVGSDSDAGKLITKGTYVEAPARVEPVVFTTDSEDTYWGMVFVSGQGEAELSVTVLQRGGDAGAVSTGRGGALVMRGPNDGTLRRMVTAHGLYVVDSGSFGVSLESGAGFVEDAESVIVVLGTGKLPRPAGYGAEFDPEYPVFVEPPGIGTLPPGVYEGGSAATDKILVVPRFAVTVDEQLHDRGVPYLMWGTLYVRPETTSTFRVDPGVEVQFHRDPDSDTRYGIQLGDGASLDPRPVTIDIEGTSERPIVFTSDAASPAAGDWMGLYLDASPASGNKLVHAQVLYAGGESGTSSYGCGPGDNDSAILITDWKPAAAFIQNVEIRDSAGGGIMCGWSSNDAGPDLKEGNTFSGIGNGCDVSRWQTEDAVRCPGRTDTMPLCL